LKAEGYANNNNAYYEIPSENPTLNSFGSTCNSATGKIIEIDSSKKLCIDSVNSVEFPSTSSNQSNYIIKEDDDTYKLTKLIPNIIAKIKLEGKYPKLLKD